MAQQLLLLRFKMIEASESGSVMKGEKTLGPACKRGRIRLSRLPVDVGVVVKVCAEGIKNCDLLNLFPYCWSGPVSLQPRSLLGIYPRAAQKNTWHHSMQV